MGVAEKLLFRLVTWYMGSGISPLSFAWDWDQKHGILGITALRLGIKYKILEYTGIIYRIRDQNFCTKWAQRPKLSKTSGIIKTEI